MLLFLIIAYFCLLLGIAYYTSRGSTNEDFFIGNRNSHWLLVAFGMIGTSLSGVTFVSVPGTVAVAHFTYFMVVLGYLMGYWVVAYLLLPLYYRLGLTSIYDYLRQRFGIVTYKTGALFFIFSRTMGATLRLYLVINVLQTFIFSAFGLNFYVSAILILAMILLYTFKGGVKSIVWTDTLQTTFMLLGLVVALGYILHSLSLSPMQLWAQLSEKDYTQMAITDVLHKKFWLKQLIGGAFITITMTGLDQEMMQKNISVRTLAGAQKNMLLFSGIMVVVNFIFLLLGGALYLFAAAKGLALKGDDLFPTIALTYMPKMVSIIFVIGLISALFPSADGAITALTSAFCIDIIGLQRNAAFSESTRTRVRLIVHLSFAVVFLGCVIGFKILNDKSIIDTLLDIAGYTYGPLLGMFAYGILTKRKVLDFATPIICIAAPALCYYINAHSVVWFGGYVFGFENLLLNGCLTFVGLWIASLFVRNSSYTSGKF
jgi:SSS family transporter